MEITQWQSSLRSDGANCHVHPASLRGSISGSKRQIDRLRLVIVHNKQRAQDHMVVAAYQDSGWLILDNRTMALITDVDASSVYLPLFVLDDTGTRRYVLSATQARLPTRPLGPAIVPVDLLENQMAAIVRKIARLKVLTNASTQSQNHAGDKIKLLVKGPTAIPANE